jgi:hypothetical protein
MIFGQNKAVKLKLLAQSKAHRAGPKQLAALL